MQKTWKGTNNTKNTNSNNANIYDVPSTVPSPSQMVLKIREKSLVQSSNLQSSKPIYFKAL